ncbi:hypothetical protein KKF34_06010 [Myxococcota bacterium]|nr:hypothetical protein [Myxococcota bacterium]MBU1381744.1 hypothetical protein [Myxococcota bacterium]MBU1496416.1 hypothetical protein [Myxococcota bacterium]
MDIFRSILEKAELTGDNIPDADETEEEDCRSFSIPDLLKTPEMEEILINQNIVPARNGYFNLSFCEIDSDSLKREDFSWLGRSLKAEAGVLSLSRIGDEIIISVNTSTLPEAGIPFSSEDFTLEVKLVSFIDFKSHFIRWTGNFTRFNLVFIPPRGPYLMRANLCGTVAGLPCMVKTSNRLETGKIFR